MRTRLQFDRWKVRGVAIFGFCLTALPLHADEVRFQVLERRQEDLGERSVIFNRVAPPALPKVVQSAPNNASTDAAQAQPLEKEKRTEGKKGSVNKS